MLQKLIIKVKCVQSGSVRGYGGTELHGWLFNWIGDFDPLLSEALHQMEEKSFVIGPIYGGSKEKGKTILIAGQEYSFTIAFLEIKMFKVLKLMLESLENEKMQIGNGQAVVKAVLPIYGEEGISYFDLLEKKHSSSEITLKFNSPTSFRKQGMQELFPQPDLVFGSLLRKWNIFSPVGISEEVDFSGVVVRRYNLKTELVDFGKYKIIGCVGSCTYQVEKKMPDYYRSILQSLAFYAGIAGVGYKTSMGLGDTRYQIK